MDNRYICKIASAEEMEQKWDYEIGIHAEKENWIAWKGEAIEGARSGRSIPYYGILDGTVICEATAIPNPDLKQAPDHAVELCAFRTNKAFRGQGYFSKLKDFMLKDLKRKGYTKAVVGVEPELFEKSPLELSGGQKRRIAIAGVIAMRPEVLILDEPTAGLDPAGCAQILENVRNYREKSGATVLIVSHSMDDVARIAERIIVFDHGGVAMDGTPVEVFSRSHELMEIGLNVPKAAELAVALRKRNIPLPESVFTHEQLIAALLAVREGKTC